MRTGQILSYNKPARVGLIRDSNNQHIFFYGNEFENTFRRGALVTFEIVLTKQSLVAINLAALK